MSTTQVQSLRQRLSELKKVSIELKSRVLQDPRIDMASVSEILMGVLPSSSNIQVSLPLSQTNTLLDVPLSRQQNLKSASNQSLTYSPNSSVFAVPPPPNAQRNQDLILWNSNANSPESSPSREAIEIQIQKLKAQNDQIQNQIFNLAVEIEDLKIVEAMREEQSWKQHLPFINKVSTLRLFLTKLYIKQYDFDKVDYEKGKCELIFDRLTIYFNNRPQRMVKLSTISQVKYIGDKKMRIDFKEQQLVYLYLQFQTQSERQEWDLALITNHKIITDKELNKHLFMEEKQLKINKTKSKSSLKVGEFDSAESKNQDRDQYNKRKGSVRVNERRLDKSSNEKESYSSSLKRSERSMERSQFDYTLNGNTQSPPETPDQNQMASSSAISSSIKEKSLKDLMVFGEVGESHHQQSRANTSKFNAPEVNFENIEIYPAFMQDAPPSGQQQTSKIENEWQKALLELKEGYFFTKYAKNGFKPHNKKVFISSEEQMLICANSEDLNDRRAIRIENITAIKYPAIGQGIRKYIKNANVENFCVIEYQNQGKDQVIELGCHKMVFIKRFSDQFREFLRKKGVLIKD